jgi:hypothetical protein
MSMNKKAVHTAVVKSRELTVEELTQVGGAWGLSDSGDYGFSNYSDYSDYSDYSYDNVPSEPSFADDPAIDIDWNGGMQVVEQTAEKMSQDEKAAYDAEYQATYNDCMDSVSTVEAIAMAVGGSYIDEFLDGMPGVVAKEVSSDFLKGADAVEAFLDRAGEVGYEAAYCEANAKAAAAEIDLEDDIETQTP